MRFLKLNPFSSLRGRHVIISSALVMLLIAVAYLTHHSIKTSREKSVTNLEARSQLLDKSTRIHNALWHGFISLEHFLIDPSKKELIQKSLNSFSLAGKYAEELKNHPWKARENHANSANQLPRIINELSISISNLIEIRTDPNRQYPALASGNETMRPNRNAFNNAMLITVREAISEEQKEHFRAVFPVLFEARHIWSQMVSNFRIYLANRLGSFNETALPIQERSVETLYEVLIAHLEKLQQLDEQGALGFESSSAVEDLFSTANNWFSGYLSVKDIHKSGIWRTDALLMETVVEPKLENIWEILQRLNQTIEASMSKDINGLNNTARTQVNVFIAITIGVILVFVFGLYSIQRLVFRPLETVSSALREEAAGRRDVLLPDAPTREIKNLVNAFSDMRMQIRSRQSALEHKSLYDDLTGLPNRTLLQDRLDQAVLHAEIDHNPVSLILLDIRNFKHINDTLGHNVGDLVLVEVSKRLSNVIREADSIARLGGDEFAIVLSDTDEQTALKIANKLSDILYERFEIDPQPVHISSSLGIAVCPTHATDSSTLIQKADIAMSIANQNNVKFALYNKESDRLSAEKLTLAADLKSAINNNHLALHYQPKLNLKTTNVVGVEALLRWKHPQFGWIRPDELVLLAEQSGFIKELTMWTVRTAIAQCASWKGIGIDLNVAINLSVHALHDLSFPVSVENLLAHSNLPPNYLAFEITESAVMTNPRTVSEVLNKLTKIGIMLSADDFGTGFSSLSNLKQMPVDEIKVDKSFVLDMNKSSTDKAIVNSAISLAHSLDIKIVAEGIEQKEVSDALVELNCDIGQGYYYSKPLSSTEFIPWLESYKKNNQINEHQTPT